MSQVRPILGWIVAGCMSISGCATPFWLGEPDAKVHMAPIVSEAERATPSREDRRVAKGSPPQLTQNSPRAAWEQQPSNYSGPTSWNTPQQHLPPVPAQAIPPQHIPQQSRVSTPLPAEPDTLRQHDPARFEEMQRMLQATGATLPPPYQQMLQEQMLAVAMPQDPRPETLMPILSQPIASTSSPPPSQNFWPSPNGETHAALASPPPVVAPANALPLAGSAVPSPAPVPPASNPVVPASATEAVTESAPEQVAESSPSAAVAQQTQAPGDWHTGIEQTIALLDAELHRESLERDEKVRLEALRRILSVAANRREDAVAPIEQLDEDEQAFWKHQMFGLLVSLDADGKHAASRRAALALRDLRTAANHLANISTLDVKNLAFCKQVQSYGEYTEFDTASFRAGEEVILYVEVDNFAAQEVGERFETELHGSYQITSEMGERVTSVVLPIDKQISNNRRRDYFIPYLLTLPKPLAAGSYRLQLTMEDVIGKKSNQASIDFRIR